MILADEPTTALDVTIQAQILHLLAELQREFSMGLVLITHDLGVVARIATRVVVMYAGEVVETGTAAAIFSNPAHPYTRGLMACIPVPGRTRRGQPLGTIPGMVPSLVGEQTGCHFAGRCSYVIDPCRRARRSARSGPRRRPSRALHPPCRDRRWRRRARRRGDRMTAATATAAQSGCRTDARSAQRVAHLSRLGRPVQAKAHPARGRRRQPRGAARAKWWRWSASPAAARPRWRACCWGCCRRRRGKSASAARPPPRCRRRAIAALVQPVFQDPYSSLNPRKSIGSIIALPLRVQGGSDSATWRRRVEEMMERVGLARSLHDNFPSQLSGGQRQRVAIARALINRPRLVICDEPTSALDVSVQSQILNLLQELRRDMGLTYLLISHNLAVVEHMATRVAVMYLGRIVEEADTDTLFRAPKHPYTQALLASVLTPEPGLGVPDTQLGAAYPNPLEVPPGCRFHPRCARVMEVCRTVAPTPIPTGGGFAECHLYSAA